MANKTKAQSIRRPSIVAILLGNLVLFLLPTIAIVAAFIYTIQRSETNQTLQYLDTEARSLSIGIANEINEAQLFMRLARRALTPLVERGDQGGCESVAAELEDGEGTLKHFFVTDSSGTVICTADPTREGETIAGSSAFEALRLGGRLYMGAPALGANNRPLVPVALGWRDAHHGARVCGH